MGRCLDKPPSSVSTVVCRTMTLGTPTSGDHDHATFAATAPIFASGER